MEKKNEFVQREVAPTSSCRYFEREMSGNLCQNQLNYDKCKVNCTHVILQYHVKTIRSEYLYTVCMLSKLIPHPDDIMCTHQHLRYERKDGVFKASTYLALDNNPYQECSVRNIARIICATHESGLTVLCKEIQSTIS
jgi:hypothetical protein